MTNKEWWEKNIRPFLPNDEIKWEEQDEHYWKEIDELRKKVESKE